jgi:hypothetical protein
MGAKIEEPIHVSKDTWQHESPTHRGTELEEPAHGSRDTWWPESRS